MPLMPGKSKKAFSHNIEVEMKSGKPQNQSLAIAYSVKRKKKKMADGGKVDDPTKKYGGSKRMHGPESHNDSPTGPTGYRNRNRSSDMSGGQRRGPQGYPKYQEQAQNEKGIHTPVSGVTAFPGAKGESEAGSMAKETYAGKPHRELRDHGKELHRKKLEEMRAMKGPNIKGLAEGGMVDEDVNDADSIRHNSGKKAPDQDSWTDRPDISQSQRGGTYSLKHPKMVPINGASLRLRDEEDDLQSSAGVNDGAQHQPPSHDNEDAPDRQGPHVRDMQDSHSTSRKPYAKGGKVEAADYDHPLGGMHEDDLTDLHPSEDEGDSMAMSHNEMDADGHGDSVRDMEEPHNENQSKVYGYARGGKVALHDEQPDEEQEIEHHSSIAAAIMAHKAAIKMLESGSKDEDDAEMMAEGGEVDLSMNADEEPNHEDQMSFEALKKENYSESEGLDQLDQPSDSNEQGDSREDDEEDKHDRISQMRSRMNMRRQFKGE